MTKVTVNGVTATIHPLTPRGRMISRGIFRKAHRFLSEWASDFGVDEADIEYAIGDYAVYCAQVTLEGDADFALAFANDPPDILKNKFEGYLNTEHIQLIDRIEKILLELNTPHDEALAPDAKPADPKN